MSCGVLDHCCHLGRLGVCPHLEEGTVPGRRWACGIMRRLGSWTAVHASPEYVRDVKPVWEASALKGQDCGDWPAPGVTCPSCGQVG